MPENQVQVELNILVIDDDPGILWSVGNYLEGRGHRVYKAGDGREGLELLSRESIDIVITDVKMPGMDGFQVLSEVRRASPGTEVIVITAFGDIESAVRAMREGAFDFFPKPFDVGALSAALQRTVRFQTLRREKDRYRRRLDRADREDRQRYGLSAIVGGSQATRDVIGLIETVCQADGTTVLVSGETGTGKELVARAIHWQSARADAAFVALDCSAIPESLVETEMFGHVKGAFTDASEARKGHFELADGGTLFLDEISGMGLEAQAKLLRSLEERRVRPVGGAREIPVDVRVISATNLDLPQAVCEGAFRQDLYYRLNAFTIHIPPLRERPDDILAIAEHFLSRYLRELHKPVGGLSPEAAALLEAHAFPGNVRELRNLIERAAILSKTGSIEADDLKFDAQASPIPEQTEYLEPQTPPAHALGSATLEIEDPGRLARALPTDDLNLSGIEREVIREALRRCAGNQMRAAGLLGVSRTALHRRMERHGLSPSEPGHQTSE